MAKWIKNADTVDHTYNGQLITPGSYYEIQSHEEVAFANDDGLLSDISSGNAIVAKNDSGNKDITKTSKAINYLKDIEDVSDQDGRKVVHQTSRKIGLITYFAGADDDHTDPEATGIRVGGDPDTDTTFLAVHHEIGDPVKESVYFDINAIVNESSLHEGYIQWKGALNDAVTMEVVPKVSTVEASTSTNYNLYGGYLVIPAAGDGTTNVTDMVLVQAPVNEFGVRAAGYWNADWDTGTKAFINVAAAPLGDGEFNMFAAEVTLHRFVFRQPVLGDGFMQLQTSDASQLGHNMRIKISGETMGSDHDWWWNASIVWHRKKTI